MLNKMIEIVFGRTFVGDFFVGLDEIGSFAFVALDITQSKIFFEHALMNCLKIWNRFLDRLCNCKNNLF